MASKRTKDNDDEKPMLDSDDLLDVGLGDNKRRKFNNEENFSDPDDGSIETSDSEVTGNNEIDSDESDVEVLETTPTAPEKRTYLNFLTDYVRGVNNAHCMLEAVLLHCLRHRMDLTASMNEEIPGQKKSHYDALLELVSGYQPAGACEIFHLLLENRLTIPLCNMLIREHYLTLLDDVHVQAFPNEQAVQLGKDVRMARIVLTSCRQQDESQAVELLKSLFSIETLHGNDLLDEISTSQPFTVDLGVGYLQDRNVLVAHVSGNFEMVAEFIKTFADVILVEEVPEVDSPRSFYSRKCWETNETIVWTPTNRGVVVSTSPEENLNKHGFPHHSVKSSFGDRLCTKLSSLLLDHLNGNPSIRKPLNSLKLMEDEELNPIKGLVPADFDEKFGVAVKRVDQVRKSFVLQQNFREQSKFEELKREYRLEQDKVEDFEAKINACLVRRRKDSVLIEDITLIKLFLDALQEKDPSVRVMTLRRIDQSLSHCTERELQSLQQQVNHFYKLKLDRVSSASSSEEAEKNYMEAKLNYREAMLHTEHVWRELSHLYIARPGNYFFLPHLAAKYLLDGFSLELLDGDASLMNLPWIKAVLGKLEEQMEPTKRRIFVLSVMGVQSSGKSTLLNTMFGIKMRTSVGQCTRGINMQLVPVEGRAEYDYVLVLDTEGMRSPDFYGMAGNDKRDNQMAALSILLADATIVVNPGENDAAVKEILPIVLMAYQGSKLAEENGGRLSTKMFFIYNRIDTTQKEKLTNIVQKLSDDLMDAFEIVRKMSGYPLAGNQKSFFRDFKLDASNSEESDVRIIGQNKVSFVPPNDVPDAEYGEALREFREHIHKRVTRSESEWSNRSPFQLADYIHKILKCINSADFHLQFTHVLERMTFDQIESEYQKIERELAMHYQEVFRNLHKSMIKDPNFAKDSNENVTQNSDMASKLNLGIQEILTELEKKMDGITNQKGREKWKPAYQQKWQIFKTKQQEYWQRQVKSSYDAIFTYDNQLELLKNEMRKEIRENFLGKATECTEERELLRTQFESLIGTFIARAESHAPPIDVRQCVNECYVNNAIIKKQQFVLFYQNSLEEERIFLEHCQETVKQSKANHESRRGFFSAIKSSLINVMQYFYKRDVCEDDLLACLSNCIHQVSPVLVSVYELIGALLSSGLECYDDSIVSDVIEQTDRTLTDMGKTDFSHSKVVHTFARLLLIEKLERIQNRWERNNSLCAKFKQQSNLDAMWEYCKMTLASSKKIALFGVLVREKFSQLSRIVEDEAVARVTRQIIRKDEQWLFDYKWTQNHMDLHLIELIDEDNVDEIVHLLRNPKDLFNLVLEKLIGEIALDSWPPGKVWRVVADVIKSAVKGSVEAAVSGTKQRAARFMAELRARLVDNLESDLLIRNLRMDLADYYKELDNEPDGEFRKVCEEELIAFIDSQFKPEEMVAFSQRVAQFVVEKLRAIKAPGVIPRCQHSCPWCGALCIRESGHDASKIKHDTIHQPGGLYGISVRGKKTLLADICSNSRDDDDLYGFFKGREERFKFRDWCAKYPNWEKPHIAQERPLSEYIFYHYHKEIADDYKLKPCTNMPESYNRDLNAIRDSLKRGPVDLLRKK